MLRWLSLAFCYLVLAASCRGQTDAPKETHMLSMQGKVIEANSGSPIRKVVQVLGGAERSRGEKSATTGADGTFTIDASRQASISFLYNTRDTCRRRVAGKPRSIYCKNRI